MKLKVMMIVCLVTWAGWVVESPAQQPSNEHRQFEWVKSRAEKGDAQAQLELGFLYASGNGVTQDLRKAAKWHHKAADQGLARAQFVVAKEFAEGEGVKLDKSEAFRWFHRAADQGLPEAQFALGQCYAKGDGVSEDEVEAVKCYRLAADQNFLAAIGELGECFLEGNGVATDIAEGIKWVRKAAELGYAPAQNRLGLCYLNGRGLPKDFVQAYKWFDLGASQGGALALDVKVNLAKAQSHMTPEQISEAQQEALDFKPHKISDEISVSDKGPNKVPGISSDNNAAPASKAGGGLLCVSAQDVSYEVYVDGSFVGNPTAKLHLTEGSHWVEVKKPGFASYRKEIKIDNGSDLNLHVALEKQ